MAGWTAIHISTDLSSKVRPYLDFLETYIQSFRIWTDTVVLRRAIYRYEQLWLPLMNDVQGRYHLEPPKDVRWVWHLHLLLTGHYVAYCRDRFGRVIAHNIFTTATEAKEARDRSLQLWYSRYRDEPFDADPGLSSRTKSLLPPSRLGEVVEFALQQETFSYQVSLPHYRDKKFVSGAVDRYKKFLYVQKFCVGSCSNTPYDIQLMWRIHALHPQDYIKDTEFLKQIYDPHQPFNEDTERNNQNVRQQWGRLFTSPFFVEGTVGRGQRFHQMSAMPKELCIQDPVDRCNITISDLEVADPDKKTGIRSESALLVDVRRLNDSSFSFSMVTTAQGELGRRIHLKPPQNSTEFDSHMHRGLEFHVYGRSGFCCCKKEQTYATLFYNPRKHFAEGSFYDRIIEVELPKVVYTDPILKFTCEVKAEERKPRVLTFTRQNFSHQTCPAPLWRCVQGEPSWQNLFTDEVDFLVAKHKIRSKDFLLNFECEVVTHDGTSSSAVLLYLEQKLLCTAHTIDPAQVPRTDQVSENCLLHTSETEDRAFLIKNQHGDWGIIIGGWQDTGSGHGKILLTLHKLQSRETIMVHVQEDEMKTLKIDNVSVDLPTGRMALHPACTSIPEQLVLAFCMGKLFIACQRQAWLRNMLPLSGSLRSVRSETSIASKPDSRLPSINGETKSSRPNTVSKIQSKKKHKQRKLSASFTFLLACGLQLDIYLGFGQSLKTNMTQFEGPAVTSKDGDIIMEQDQSAPKSTVKLNGAVGPNRLSAHIMNLPTKFEEDNSGEIMDIKL